MGYDNNGNEFDCIAWRLEKALKVKHERTLFLHAGIDMNIGRPSHSPEQSVIEHAGPTPLTFVMRMIDAILRTWCSKSLLVRHHVVILLDISIYISLAPSLQWYLNIECLCSRVSLARPHITFSLCDIGHEYHSG